MPFRREDDNDDESPPQSSMGHTNVGPERGSGLLVARLTVPETPPSQETTGDGEMTMGIETTPLIGLQLPFSPGTRCSGFAGASPLVRKVGLISK